MKKRLLSIMLAVTVVLTMVSCSGKDAPVEADNNEPGKEESLREEEVPAEGVDKGPEETGAGIDDFRIGIVTGSYSQSEDDRRGAEAFQKKYGQDAVTLAIYPDNFTEEQDSTVQIMVGLADDPKIKAIIVNQAVDGTTEAFRQIHEKRPDILCFAGEAYEDFSEISRVADLVVNYDFVSRGYLIVHTAHELGCDTFVHVSFPRHLELESVSRQVAVMRAACEEFGMKFMMEEAPDPTTEVGVPGAQAYIREHVTGWIEK